METKLGQFEFNKTEFLANIETCNFILPKKCTIPSLRSIRLLGNQEEKSIQFFVSDNDIEVCILNTKECDNITDFDILIDSVKLVQILKKIDNAVYKFIIYQDHTEISGFDCKFGLNRIINLLFIKIILKYRVLTANLA